MKWEVFGRFHLHIYTSIFDLATLLQLHGLDRLLSVPLYVLSPDPAFVLTTELSLIRVRIEVL